jgi:hypothetical protein
LKSSRPEASAEVALGARRTLRCELVSGRLQVKAAAASESQRGRAKSQLRWLTFGRGEARCC